MRVLFLFFLVCCVQANESKPTIIWALYGARPFNIQDGMYSGKGIEDFSVRAIETQLKMEYNLDEWKVPFTRSFTFFKNKENYCLSGLFKTADRENFIYFSPFLNVSFTHVLIAKKGLLDTLSSNTDNKKIINLKKVIDYNKYIIGIEQTASYGSLDPILKEALIKNPSSFFIRPGVGSRDALFKMLQSNRIQIYLGHPEETLYYSKMALNQKKNPVITEMDFFHIQENKANYILEYIGCSKTPQGKKIIDKISKIMLSKEFNRKKLALEGAKEWLDLNSLKLFEQYFDEEIKKEAKNN